MINLGVLYVVDGLRYANEVKLAVLRLRQISNINICIISNELYSEFDIFNNVNNLEIKILQSLQETKFASKVIGLLNSPFERTLFMDTDTFVVNKIDFIFELLNLYDCCFTLEPSISTTQFELLDDYVNSIGEFNSGVVLFNNSEIVMDFFRFWMEILNNKKYSQDYFDMPQLRNAYINCNLKPRIGIMPDNFNLHGLKSYLIIHGTVYIIHERFGTYYNSFSERMLSNKEMLKISERINKTSEKRLFIPFFNMCIATRKISLAYLVTLLKIKFGFRKVSKRNGK
jgi:hypothetical protein